MALAAALGLFLSHTYVHTNTEVTSRLCLVWFSFSFFPSLALLSSLLSSLPFPPLSLLLHLFWVTRYRAVHFALPVSFSLLLSSLLSFLWPNPNLPHSFFCPFSSFPSFLPFVSSSFLSPFCFLQPSRLFSPSLYCRPFVYCRVTQWCGWMLSLFIVLRLYRRTIALPPLPFINSLSRPLRPRDLAQGPHPGSLLKVNILFRIFWFLPFLKKIFPFQHRIYLFFEHFSSLFCIPIYRASSKHIHHRNWPSGRAIASRTHRHTFSSIFFFVGLVLLYPQHNDERPTHLTIQPLQHALRRP